MSNDSPQLEPDSEIPTSAFPDFESAMQAVHMYGVDGVSQELVDYFSNPDREAEIEPLFSALNFQGQFLLIKVLMLEVFEGQSHHHKPPMIVYRKRIAESLGITKGQTSLRNAISEARIGRPDAAIAFFRANPAKIKTFLGDFRKEFPDEADAATLHLVRHLLRKLQG